MSKFAKYGRVWEIYLGIGDENMKRVENEHGTFLEEEGVFFRVLLLARRQRAHPGAVADVELEDVEQLHQFVRRYRLHVVGRLQLGCLRRQVLGGNSIGLKKWPNKSAKKWPTSQMRKNACINSFKIYRVIMVVWALTLDSWPM